MTMSLELRKALGNLIMIGMGHIHPDNWQMMPLYEIEEFVVSLNLKDRKCGCGTVITFYQWHEWQGMCEKCHDMWNEANRISDMLNKKDEDDEDDEISIQY